ncbi:NTP transferase domain-containing protein [bacterium]|nr:NTP transferase domain-containing protein [bacterium]
MAFDAILLAGGLLSPEDPLYPKASGGHRSLIPINGKPMAQWVLDALTASEVISRVIVIGLAEDCSLTSVKPLAFLPDEGGVFENMRAGSQFAAETNPDQHKVIIASADIPAIRPEMLAWLAGQIEQNPETEIYYNVITQDAMEERYPNANRSYVRFRDCAVCGGDLNALDTRFFASERPVWHRLTEARKSPLKQAGILGLDTLALVLLHAITLDGAVRKVCRRLDLRGRALRCPYPEMAMDADKPHQLVILRQDLEARS